MTIPTVFNTHKIFNFL